MLLAVITLLEFVVAEIQTTALLFFKSAQVSMIVAKVFVALAASFRGVIF
jgi:hypothetical protein